MHLRPHRREHRRPSVAEARFLGDFIFDAVAEAVREGARSQQRDEALRATEDRMRRVVEASSAGLWAVDVAAGDVAADARMEEFMGLHLGSSFTLQSGLATLPADDHERVRDAVTRALAGEHGGRYRMEFRTGGFGCAPRRWVGSLVRQFARGGRW